MMHTPANLKQQQRLRTKKGSAMQHDCAEYRSIRMHTDFAQHASRTLVRAHAPRQSTHVCARCGTHTQTHTCLTIQETDRSSNVITTMVTRTGWDGTLRCSRWGAGTCSVGRTLRAGRNRQTVAADTRRGRLLIAGAALSSYGAAAPPPTG
jgi:hypothetical protein